jgi:hypothetical protein
MNFRRISELQATYRRMRMVSACRFAQHFGEVEELLSVTKCVWGQSAEPSVLYLCTFEVKIAIAKFKRYK